MSTNQLMTSAMVEMIDHRRKPIRCRALLDTCSTVNLMSEKLAEKLKLPRTKCRIPVGALNNIATSTNYRVTATLKSTKNNYMRTLEFLTIPSISEAVPLETIRRNEINIPANIALADPMFHKAAPIDVLLGTGPTLALFCIGQINISKGNTDLYLQKTRLGWIIGGHVNPKKRTKDEVCNFIDLHRELERFWKIEEGPTQIHQSEEEIQCEQHFRKHTVRNAAGRYVVALPFKDDTDQLGESRMQAMKRLNLLEKRFQRDPVFKEQYKNVIAEYAKLGHMDEINDDKEQGYYLPHHAVIKETSSTTKLRVVFDGSAKTNSGVSLNDILMVGPTIQDDIFALLLRFRLHNFVVTADIEKMYRQILIRNEDRKYQRILWKEGEHIKTYQLNTVTFGLASAPFLAIRCLKQLADDEGHQYPIAARILKEDLYVDNLLSGAETKERAQEIRIQMTNLLSLGGFNLRQWASNDMEVLHGVEKDAIDANFQLDHYQPLKTLGLSWNAQEDKIIYTVNSTSAGYARTKRTIFSEIAKIFDPLGLLGPVIMYAKIIMQDIWKESLNWDESVPMHIHTQWVEFCEQLKNINSISFNRHSLVTGRQSVQMHGFCDASIKGYGACIYLRSTNQIGESQCRLFCAKSRVAPIKMQTIPRLELCAAQLLVKLHKQITSNIDLPIERTVFWSDSTITLHWINSPPHILKTFVANRVSEIQTETDPHQWKYVPSHDNPADALSRGQLPAEFTKNNLWNHGPKWLSENEASWPQPTIPGLTTVLPETRKETCMFSKARENEIVHNSEPAIFNRFSTYRKLKRFVALALYVKRGKEYTGTLRSEDITNAESVIIKRIQALHFPEEIRNLTKGNALKKNSKLASLCPFVDKNEILRVGGRLKNSDLLYSQQHPIILPRSNHVTSLIIQDYHHQNHHAGNQTTLCALRQKFWILDGRNQVRKVIRSCIQCFRAKPATIDYLMGDLPSVRLQQSRVFHNVGIDYCGPFSIKEKKHRNTKTLKVYVAVFVCLAVKAIHMEIVSDLTTEGFLAALRRFIARRGKPQNIYSDNGTNFVGANNELKELHNFLQSDKQRRKINNFFIDREIKWHFIPPLSPHFGGLWEATVKMFKYHMKRVITDKLFTFEEFNTFVIEVESILNSRPLTPLSTDPNDPPVLTPAHFLIGDYVTSLPEADFRDSPSNRLSRWQHIQKVRQHFWSRWHKEYLNQLNIRHKWTSGKHPIKEDSIVLIREENQPSMQWALGRVIKCHPGTDGIVRTVTLKTATRELKRNVKRLALLPIIDNYKNESDF